MIKRESKSEIGEGVRKGVYWLIKCLSKSEVGKGRGEVQNVLVEGVSNRDLRGGDHLLVHRMSCSMLSFFDLMEMNVCHTQSCRRVRGGWSFFHQ